MTDLHTHTYFSADSTELPENHIERALALGCKALGFSEHLDYDYLVNGITVNGAALSMTNLPAYAKNTAALQEKYRGKIEILFGIEYAYHAAAVPLYQRESAVYPFDYVINSVHVAGGKDCYFKEYFEGKTRDDAYLLYLRTVLESLYAAYDYQIVGHIGYVVRNAPYADKNLSAPPFKNAVDDILKAVIEKEKALELNTNVYGLQEPFMPAPAILKRYAELGGRLVSFGSDAHKSARLLQNYSAVTNALQAAGIRELCYFKKKKLYRYKI
jgi:histidinol-phosphatase (PHP family)